MADPAVLRAGPWVLGAALAGVKTHALLRIREPQALRNEENSGSPAWVHESLARAPWVVVRRAPLHDGLIPVGVRGESRQQRFASWVQTDAVLEVLTPQALAARRSWATSVRPARRAAAPALAELDLVERIMAAHSLGGVWGPAGSVGFELASGRATATASSDLDLVVDVGELGSISGRGSAQGADSDRSGATIDRLDAIAGSLWGALAALSVRVDVLLEMTDGAVALSEFVRSRDAGGTFVLRTTRGPRLTQTLGHTLRLRA